MGVHQVGGQLGAEAESCRSAAGPCEAARSQPGSRRQSQISTPTAPAGKPGVELLGRSVRRVAQGDRKVVVRTARCEPVVAVK